MDNIRKCPCCGNEITGQVDNPNLRQGVKMGAKFAAKEGAKYIAGEGLSQTAGAIGASVGSVIPFVGTFLGYVVGYSVAHAAQELAFDVAYDAAEEKLATKKYLYYCPSCNLIWTSDETDNRNIIIRNFVDFYNANSRKYPDRPKVNNFFDKHDSFYTVGFILGILFLWSLYKVITEDITYGVYEFILAISVLYGAIIATAKTVFYFKYKEDVKKYANEIEEIDIYNDKLKNDLLQRFNTIVNNNSPLLGETLNELPFNDEKRDIDDLDDAIDDARTSILVFWGVILLAIALAIGACNWSSDTQSVSKEEYPAETTNQGEFANSSIGSETDSKDVVYTDDALNKTEQDAIVANEDNKDFKLKLFTKYFFHNSISSNDI